MSDDGLTELSGGCLCGAVRYRIKGPRRNIILCHCRNCRRTHGHIAAYTALRKSDLSFDGETTLSWYHDESPDTWRGFCSRCGASLFWDMRNRSDKISVAAGSLDDSAELKTIGHIFVSEAGRYYEIDDGLPCFELGSGGALDNGGSG